MNVDMPLNIEIKPWNRIILHQANLSNLKNMQKNTKMCTKIKVVSNVMEWLVYFSWRSNEFYFTSICKPFPWYKYSHCLTVL